jgi:hypothetical protein
MQVTAWRWGYSAFKGNDGFHALKIDNKPGIEFKMKEVV